jgi:hypothetical protein
VTAETLHRRLDDWATSRGYQPTLIRIRNDVWQDIRKWTTDEIGGLSPTGLNPTIYLFGCRVEVVPLTGVVVGVADVEFVREVASHTLKSDCTADELLQDILQQMDSCRTASVCRLYDTTQETASIIRQYFQQQPARAVPYKEEASPRTRVVELE